MINERDPPIHGLLLKTSSQLLASRQSEGTPHNGQLIPPSLALIKSRSKTSSGSPCDIWRLVILHCAPAVLPAPGSGLGVVQGHLPGCLCRAGRHTEEKEQSLALLVSVVISLIGSGLYCDCNSLLRSFPSPGSLAQSLCKYSVAAGFLLHPFQVRQC